MQFRVKKIRRARAKKCEVMQSRAMMSYIGFERARAALKCQLVIKQRPEFAAAAPSHDNRRRFGDALSRGHARVISRRQFAREARKSNRTRSRRMTRRSRSLAGDNIIAAIDRPSHCIGSQVYARSQNFAKTQTSSTATAASKSALLLCERASDCD